MTSTFTGATDQNFHTATNWNPTGVPANDGTNQFQVVIPASVALPVLLDLAATVNSIGIGAGSTFSIQDNIALTSAGDVTNDGLILLSGTSGSTSFRVSDPVDQSITLGGAGILRLTDPNQFISGSFNNVLTQGASHTIEGTGRIGDTDFGFVNLGTVLANNSGGTLRFRPRTFQNGGLVRAENGGILAVSGGGTVSQTPGGRFEVADGAHFDFEGTTLVGVFLTADDQNSNLSDNLYSLSEQGTRFKNVTLAATLSNNGKQLSLIGDLTNNGIFRASGSDLFINDADDQRVRLSGTGRLVMEAPVETIGSGFGQILTNGAPHTIEGSGVIGVYGLINESSIFANVPGQTLRLRPTTFQNGGLVRAENGGILAVSVATVSQTTGGRFEVADGARFDFENTILDGVSLTVDDRDGDISNNLYSLSQQGTTFKAVTLEGTLLSNAPFLSLGGDFINNGIFRLSSLVFLRDADDGKVLLGGTGRTIIEGAGNGITGDFGQVLTNGPAHTIEGTGQIGGIETVAVINEGTIIANAATPLTFRQRDYFRNSGTIRVEPGSRLSVITAGFSNSGLIDIRPGGGSDTVDLAQSAGELRVNGNFVTGNLGVSGGAVTGAGIIQGSSIQIFGTLKPGNPVGSLKFQTGAMTVGATAEIELQSDSVHDNITFSGHLSGSITLALKLVGPASGFNGGPIEIFSNIKSKLDDPGGLELANVPNGGRLVTTDGRASFIVNGSTASSQYTLTSPLFAPEFTAEPYALSIDESAPVGTTVGTVSAIDPEGSGVTYSIAGSTPFAIGAGNGVITLSGPLDFGSQPVHVIQVGASDGSMTAFTPVTITVNPPPGSNAAIVNDLLTGAGGPFAGQTDPAVVGFRADPDGDGIPNVFELLLGSDPAVAGVPADLVVFPLTVGPGKFAALDVTVVKSVDDVLAVTGQLSHGLQTFRNGTRSQLSETATTRRLRFLDSVAIPAAKAFGRLAADPGAVK